MIVELFEQLVRTIWLPFYLLVVVAYLMTRILHEYYFFANSKSRTRQITPVVQTTPLLPASTAAAKDADDRRPIVLTGEFKLVENTNFEAFLAAQGVPWALRRAANGARPVHKITHHPLMSSEKEKDDLITIQICGIIESSTTYQIGGPPVQGQVRGRTFEDSVEYMTKGESKWDTEQEKEERENDNVNGISNDNKDKDAAIVVVGIQTTKKALDDGYTVVVQRRLTDDGSQIIMTSSVTFDDPAKQQDNVQSRQVFERVG